MVQLASHRLAPPSIVLLLQAAHCGAQHGQRFSNHLLLVVAGAEYELAVAAAPRRIDPTELVELVALDFLVHVLRARVQFHHEFLTDQGEPTHARKACAVLTCQLPPDQLRERIERSLVLVLVHAGAHFLFVVLARRGEPTRWNNVVLAADPCVADDLAVTTDFDVACHLRAVPWPIGSRFRALR